MLCPIPVRQSAVVRKRTSMGATVLTGSPHKIALEETLSKKTEKIKSVELKQSLKTVKKVSKKEKKLRRLSLTTMMNMWVQLKLRRRQLRRQSLERKQ